MSIHWGSQSGTAPRFTFPPVISTATFIRKLRGLSQAILVEDSDRNLYVLKMNIPQNTGFLANEWIGTSLCRALGLSVPQSHLMEFDERFIDHYSGSWFQTSNGLIRPPAGRHYGTSLVGNAEGLGRPFDVLPKTCIQVLENHEQLYGMYLFDIWANHLNHRQRIYLANLERRSFSAMFISNGSLFGGPLWDFTDSELQTAFRRIDAGKIQWQNSVLQTWFERFRTIIPKALPEILNTVPSEWCAGDLKTLEGILSRRLEAIEAIAQPLIPSH